MDSAWFLSHSTIFREPGRKFRPEALSKSTTADWRSARFIPSGAPSLTCHRRLPSEPPPGRCLLSPFCRMLRPRAKGDKLAPFDRGDFGLWLGGLQAVVPSHHKCNPTTPGAKSARPEGWLHIGPSAALRRLPDAPHRAARRALPSGADLQPSNDPNLSPFALNWFARRKRHV